MGLNKVTASFLEMLVIVTIFTWCYTQNTTVSIHEDPAEL
jgi:hypothetical protein